MFPDKLSHDGNLERRCPLQIILSYPEIDKEFLYGFEYGNPEIWNNGNSIIYPTKCFQISKNCIERFELEVETGNIFFIYAVLRVLQKSI